MKIRRVESRARKLEDRQKAKLRTGSKTSCCIRKKRQNRRRKRVFNRHHLQQKSGSQQAGQGAGRFCIFRTFRDPIQGCD